MAQHDFALFEQQLAGANGRGGNGGGKPKPAPEEPSGPTFTSVYVLGDSLVDSGNILDLANFVGSIPLVSNPDGAPYASDGYFDGRFSNGYVYTDLLANKYVGAPTDEVFPFGYEVDTFLGYVPLDPTAGDPDGISLNFAYGGAQIIRGDEAASHLDHQTDALKDAVDHDFDPNALVLVTIGGNDVRALAPAGSDPVDAATAYAALDVAAAKLLREMNQLIDEGAENIVITGIPDIGIILKYDRDDSGALEGDELIRSEAASEYAAYLDMLIRTEVMDGLEARNVNVTYVPLSNVTDADGNVIQAGALDSVLPTLEALYDLAPGTLTDNLFENGQYVFFDEVHPNAQVHALVGSYIHAEVTGTAWIETMPLAAADIVFAAQGTIAANGETDSFTVTLLKGETYTVEALGMSTLGADGSLADPMLTISAPRGGKGIEFSALSGDDSGLGFDAMYSFVAPRSGEYTITIGAEGSVTGGYVIQIGTPGAALTSAALATTTRETEQVTALAAASLLAMPGTDTGVTFATASESEGEGGSAISFAAQALAEAAHGGIDVENIAALLAAVPATGADRAAVSTGETTALPAPALAELPDTAARVSLSDIAASAADAPGPIGFLDLGDGAAMQAVLMLAAAPPAPDAPDMEGVGDALGEVLGSDTVDAIIDAMTGAVDTGAPPAGAVDFAAILDGVIAGAGLAPGFVADLAGDEALAAAAAMG